MTFRTTLFRLVSIILLLLSFNGISQTTQSVQSTCTAHDTVTKKYRNDADRLSIRWLVSSADPYKDSAVIKKTLKSTILNALLAVYNATAIPVVDTVMRQIHVHASPAPELNKLEIQANGSNSFMQKLQNSQTPTGNTHIDGLMTKFKFSPYSYFQATNYDIAILRTDTNYNLAPIAGSFATNPFILNCVVVSGSDNTQEITATVSATYVDMTFTHSWGTCADGCDYTISWKFRIHNSCVVEYMGWTGNRLDTGIPANGLLSNDVKIFPNPFNTNFTIQSGGGVSSYSVYNAAGQAVLSGPISGNSVTVDTQQLARGLYFLVVSGETSSGTSRIIKN